MENERIKGACKGFSMLLFNQVITLLLYAFHYKKIINNSKYKL